MSFHTATALAGCGGGLSGRQVMTVRRTVGGGAPTPLPPFRGISERIVSLRQRRRRKTQRSPLRKALDSEFAKPIGALLLLGLLYLALKVGLIAWVVAQIIAPIGGGTITADELYRKIKDKV